MRDSVLKIERTPLTRESRRPTASTISVLRGREVHAAHGRRPRRLSARAPDACAFPGDLPHRAHQRGDVRRHRRSERRVRRDPDGRRVPERGRQHALDGVLLQRGVRRPDDAAAADRPGRESTEPGPGRALDHGNVEPSDEDHAVGQPGLHVRRRHPEDLRHGVLGRAGGSRDELREGPGHVEPVGSQQLRRLCRVRPVHRAAENGRRAARERDAG